MEITKSTVSKLYNLKNLVRYNQRFRIASESVAEHSYFVSLFTMVICDKLGVNKNVRIKSLEYAIIHDIPEIQTSDIPYPVKQGNEVLSQCIKKMEYDAIYNLLPGHAVDFQKIDESKTDSDNQVNMIVKIADILSVIQYCNLERSLGNTNIEEVLRMSLNRLQELESEFPGVFPDSKFPLNIYDIV